LSSYFGIKKASPKGYFLLFSVKIP